MTDQPFTPHADSIQTAWVLMCQQSRIATQPPVEELEAEFDRFLARVRRDAAREALTTLAAEHQARSVGNGLISDMHLMAQQRAEAWRDHTYPEETP